MRWDDRCVVMKARCLDNCDDVHESSHPIKNTACHSQVFIYQLYVHFFTWEDVNIILIISGTALVLALHSGRHF